MTAVECIYCRRANEAKALEHVYPEALGAHDWTLPRSTVCDRCNQKLKKVDRVLVEHPYFSLIATLFQVPGKNGVRKQLGHFSRPSSNSLRIGLPRTFEHVRVDRGGTRMIIQASLPNAYDEWKFRRALFKIALNVEAHRMGRQKLLHERYDKAREFIRGRRRSDGPWPYVVDVSPATEAIARRAGLSTEFAHVNAPTTSGLRLRLLGFDYYVSLETPFLFAREMISANPSGGMVLSPPVEASLIIDPTSVSIESARRKPRLGSVDLLRLQRRG